MGYSPWGPKESDMRVTQHACVYLGINLTIRVKDLYTKHHKTLLKEIQDIIKWKNTPCSLVRMLNIYKMEALPKLSYIFNSVPIRRPRVAQTF